MVTSLTSGAPIIVERAMYLDTSEGFYGAGHASAGVTTPSTDWFLAEGATGFFDEFILIANPNSAGGGRDADLPSAGRRNAGQEPDDSGATAAPPST